MKQKVLVCFIYGLLFLVWPLVWVVGFIFHLLLVISILIFILYWLVLLQLRKVQASTSCKSCLEKQQMYALRQVILVECAKDLLLQFIRTPKNKQRTTSSQN